jgi:magnesium-transporting ATPase (P-type)
VGASFPNDLFQPIEHFSGIHFLIISSAAKTGTLTEDGLELKGVLPSADQQLLHLVEDMTSLDRNNPLLWGLASCHSLTRIQNR